MRGLVFLLVLALMLPSAFARAESTSETVPLIIVPLAPPGSPDARKVEQAERKAEQAARSAEQAEQKAAQATRKAEQAAHKSEQAVWKADRAARKAEQAVRTPRQPEPAAPSGPYIITDPQTGDALLGVSHPAPANGAQPYPPIIVVPEIDVPAQQPQGQTQIYRPGAEQQPSNVYRPGGD